MYTFQVKMIAGEKLWVGSLESTLDGWNDLTGEPKQELELDKIVLVSEYYVNNL